MNTMNKDLANNIDCALVYTECMLYDAIIQRVTKWGLQKKTH